MGSLGAEDRRQPRQLARCRRGRGSHPPAAQKWTLEGNRRGRRSLGGFAAGRTCDCGPKVTRARAKKRSATRSDAVAYLAKAQEFLRAANDSLELPNRTAATGNAVHAGIAASDALSAVLAGSVSQGDHSDAPVHLDAIGGPANDAARQLRQLLPLKTRAEYDPRPISATDARKAVSAAQKMVKIAEEAATSSGSR
jgi:hypothetical protein